MAINNCVFSGNIGKDCEVKFTKNGKAIASFSLPVKSGWGENETTSWINCKLFGKRAEGKLPQHLLKGTKVTVSGALQVDEWEGQDGQKNKMVTLLVNDVDFGGTGGGAQPAVNQSDDLPF